MLLARPAGLICALPLFFEVAIVLLISVAFSMARHTGTNLVKLVIPLFAGVAAAAAFLRAGARADAAGFADARRFRLDDPDWSLRHIPGMITPARCG